MRDPLQIQILKGPWSSPSAYGYISASQISLSLLSEEIDDISKNLTKLKKEGLLEEIEKDQYRFTEKGQIEGFDRKEEIRVSSNMVGTFYVQECLKTVQPVEKMLIYLAFSGIFNLKLRGRFHAR